MATECPKCHTENPPESKYCKECASALLTRDEMDVIHTRTVETPIQELTTGITFAGRYQIIEELGKGGMGKVYKVLDTKIDEKIALKLIKPEISSDKNIIERFSNELKLARQIGHRNVARMYHLEEDRGTHYITMEFIPGEDLKSMIRMSGQMGIGTAVNIARQICDGLAEAHRLGVIHRDLKPSNIMIDKEGSARIMDFGIARSLKAKGLTGPGIMIGTPEYMSPEQVEAKEVDQRADIYSLGIILYEMLTGRVPFQADTPFAVGIKQKSEKPEDPRQFNPRISEDLSALILRCLAKDKSERYQSTEAVRSAIDGIEEGMPTTQLKEPKGVPLTSKEITVSLSVKKLLVPALIVAALVVIALIGWKFLGPKAAAPEAGGKPSLAVLYFKNSTGDAELDQWRTALTELVTSDLHQSKYMRVLTGIKVYDILEDLNQLEAQNYSTDTLMEVASRGGVNHILTGSYTRGGDVYRMNITLHDAATAEVVASERFEGTGDESFFSMVDELTPWIKRQFNLTRSEIAGDIDRHVSEITTAHPEALKFYVEGRKLHLNAENRASIAAMEKAVAIDPEFAMAYRSMAMSYGNLRLHNERGEYIRKAMALAERLPDRERLQIQGDYYTETEETYDRAVEAFEKLVELYPDALNAYNNLGIIYDRLAEIHKAIHWYEESIKYGDSSVTVYTNLSAVYRRADMYDKAEELLRSYLRDYSEDPLIYLDLSLQFRNMGDPDRAQEELDKAFLLDPSLFEIIARRGDILQQRGDLDGAETEYRKLLERKEPIARIFGFFGVVFLHYQRGQYGNVLTELNGLWEFIRGFNQPRWISRGHRETSYLYYRTRRSQEAIKEADSAYTAAAQVNYSPSMQQALFLKCLAYTQMDALAEAEKTAGELKALIDSGRNRKAIQLFYHASGEIELQKGNQDRAIELFQQSISLLEYGPLDYPAFSLEPLARALYVSGDLENAQKEYERISSLISGIVFAGDIYAISFYMLGKICEQQGQTEQAIEYYDRFLELWKDADPGLVEADDARARIAALKR